MKMKKILGILLALCFVLSVTAAAVSAAPYSDGKNGYNNHNDGNNMYDNHNGNNKYDNHDGNNKYDNHNGNKKYDNHYGKKKYFMKGHWGQKKVRHNKDKHHKSFWFTFDKCWIPGYWYWK